MDESQSREERRRWPRFRVGSVVRLKVSRNGIEHNFSGTCYEISEGGALLLLANEVHVGEEVRLQLALPYGGPVEGVAVVRNQQHGECGIEFTAIADDARLRLARNCTALALLR